MKKAVLIIATLCLFTGCRSGYSGYGYSPGITYYSPSTAVTPASTQVYPSTYYNPYTPTYYYYPYQQPYYYPRYNPYYYQYRYSYPQVITTGPHWCELKDRNSSLNLSLESSDKAEKRSIADGKLRAEIVNKETQVEFVNQDEKLNLLTDKDGKTWISGNLKVDGEPTKLDPNTQKCTSTLNKIEEDPEHELAKFNCTDGNLKIKAEVLVSRLK